MPTVSPRAQRAGQSLPQTNFCLITSVPKPIGVHQLVLQAAAAEPRPRQMPNTTGQKLS